MEDTDILMKKIAYDIILTTGLWGLITIQHVNDKNVNQTVRFWLMMSGILSTALTAYKYAV